MTHDRRLHRQDPEQRRPARGPPAAARARVVAAELPELVGVDGPDAADRGRLPAHRGQRRPRGLGALRPRRDEGLPLGHLPRRARHRPPDRLRRAQGRAGLAEGARRVPRRPAAADRRSRATPSRRRVEQQRNLGATAPSCTTCATCSRSTSRRAVTSGRWSTCCTRTSGARAARRPRSCCTATPAARTRRASSARSTRRRRTGSSFFMFTYFTDRDGKYQLGHAEGVARSTRCRAPASSCSRRRPHHMMVGTTGIDRVVERTAS